MALLKYFKPRQNDSLPDHKSCPSLTAKELKSANDSVSNCHVKSTDRQKYSAYSAEERAQIGKYAAENGPTRASKYFSKILKKNVPEPTARRFRAEYVKKLEELSKNTNGSPVVLKALPTKARGRPLLLGPDLDSAVKEYVESTRKVGGVVNTTLVMAGAEGIVAARDRSLLVANGGHIEITKAWAASLLQRMGYVKRKGSNAGKVSQPHLEELREIFLADIQAEVLMNDIPPDLIFNWDQTGLHLVSTSEWTMNRSGAKVVVISKSDDKRQVTAVLAGTLSGEFLTPQILYQGKTNRCHPKASAPSGWDIWHSENHWSNEDTMKRYLLKVVVPYLNTKRQELHLASSHPALAIFDCFKGQTTPEFLLLLEEHNIFFVQVPANCTDRLQPLDVSVNKPIKDHLRKSFHSWYASEVQKQLLSGVPLASVKVDVSASAIKAKSLHWFVSAWESLKDRPEIIINGFKKTGIYDAVNAAITD